MAEWSYTLNGTTISEDELCRWWLKHGSDIYNSVTPQPLINKALTEGWWTVEDVKEVKEQLGLS